MFKVEIRADCKVCGGEIVHNRFRTYCSEKCRIKHNNQKYYPKQLEWLRTKREKLRSLHQTRKLV